MDPAGWTACRHDSAKDPTRILQEKKGYSKNILVRINKFTRITAVKGLVQK
jgi:hypothetical protein